MIPLAGRPQERFWESRLRNPWSYAIMALIIFGADLLSSPYLMFPSFYVLPVLLCAWYCSTVLASIQAVLYPLFRLALVVLLEHSHPLMFAGINALNRIAILLLLVYLVARSRRTIELEQEVRMLRGILPTCMFCKRIRDERGSWTEFELYISGHSDARFSHGLCPECGEKHYGVSLPKKE